MRETVLQHLPSVSTLHSLPCPHCVVLWAGTAAMGILSFHDGLLQSAALGAEEGSHRAVKPHRLQTLDLPTPPPVER